jgi:LPS-assembly protein
MENRASSRLALHLFERNYFRDVMQCAEQRRLPVRIRTAISKAGFGLRFWGGIGMTIERQRGCADVIRRRRDDDSGQPSPAPEATVIVLAIAETTILATHVFTFMSAAVRIPMSILGYDSCFRDALATLIMPCYGFLLRPLARKRAYFLLSTNRRVCHSKTVHFAWTLPILLACFPPAASPQISSAAVGAANATPSVPPPPSADDQATVERPDFSVRVPRPNAPALGDYDMDSDEQRSDNGVYYLRGHVVIELHNATFRADEADYDEKTEMFTARGHVYYRNYEQNEVIYCDRAVYDYDKERGTFYHVRGYSKTKVVARPGVLTTQQPFYFEGAYADKFEDKYILHDGFITDCKIPNPWWTLNSGTFDIIPDDRAITHGALYRLHGFPLFYFPYFYKSLKKEPRKSGFLTPNVGNSSELGYMFGVGYYWAINRSMDATYLFQDFTARGYAHHLDLRGKPTDKTDFNMIFYGVQDRGRHDSNGNLIKNPGYSIDGTARTEFGNGWVARGAIDYLSSFAFRQQFSQSFNEAIYAESHSNGYLEKNFSYYTFDTEVSRVENFQDAAPGNSIVIRKLPEFDFSGRDDQIYSGILPVWLSFDTSFGLYHRVEPKPEGEPQITPYYETKQFTPRADIEPTLSTVMRWHGVSLMPEFTMHETYYGQSIMNNTVMNAGLNRSAPELDVNLVLPSIERIYNRKTFLGDKLKHVVEASASYKYVSGVKRFQDTLLFDPIDLLSDTNQAQISIVNRLYAKKGDSVREVLTWEVAQQRFFNPTFGGAALPGERDIAIDALDLTGFTFLEGARTYSPIISNLRVSPRDGITISWLTDYDPARHAFVNSSLQGDVRVKRYFVSIGSDQIKPDPIIAPPQNQFRFTVGYGDPNRKGWNTAFQTVYDVRLARLDFGIAQVTYNTDCCGLSLQIRRFDFGTRNENQYLISFSIANVGSVGNLKKQERLF